MSRPETVPAAFEETAGGTADETGGTAAGTGASAGNPAADPAKKDPDRDPPRCERLQNGTPVWIDRVHRFGSDALLLARFCRVHRDERVCDLASGCGIIALCWHDAGHRGPCLALELQPAAAALLQKALDTPCLVGQATDGAPDPFAHASHIRGVCGDLRGQDWYTAPERAAHYDLVCCNPPYFSAGLVSPDAHRAAARHQLTVTTQEVCFAAARLLRDRGRLCLCQRPAALPEVFCACQAAGLQPKRLQLLRAKPGSRPWLFLLDARKAGGPGLEWLEDCIISF